MAMHASDLSTKALHVQEGAEPATYSEGSSRNDLPAKRTGPAAPEESRFPRSTVAPSVGDESLQPVTDTQAGNTMPGQTGKDSKDVIPDVPDRPEGVAADGSKVGFIDRVKGFAKKDAGKFFHNEKEVAQGEAALRGEGPVVNKHDHYH